jgi:hypothetical protein
MDTQVMPVLRKHEILGPMHKERWAKHDRLHLTTRQIATDLLEVRTARGTLLGTYQRVKHMGWIEIS